MPPLTNDEILVARIVYLISARGRFGYKLLASELGCTHGAAKRSVQRIFKKLGIDDILNLCLWYYHAHAKRR